MISHRTMVWALNFLILAAVVVLASFAHCAGSQNVQCPEQTGVEWTRFTGTVKNLNLKASNLTIQNPEGDLITVPVDYQVTVIVGKGKKGVVKVLKDVALDDTVTLTRTLSEKPKEENEGLVPYRGMQ